MKYDLIIIWIIIWLWSIYISSFYGMYNKFSWKLVNWIIKDNWNIFSPNTFIKPILITWTKYSDNLFNDYNTIIFMSWDYNISIWTNDDDWKILTTTKRFKISKN